MIAPEIQEMVLELWRSKWSQRIIAKKLGLARASVYAIVKRGYVACKKDEPIGYKTKRCAVFRCKHCGQRFNVRPNILEKRVCIACHQHESVVRSKITLPLQDG